MLTSLRIPKVSRYTPGSTEKQVLARRRRSS